MTISHVKGAMLAGGVLIALVAGSAPLSAAGMQAVTQPTPMQQAQQRGREQALQKQKQSHRLQRDQTRRMQETTRRAYSDQPALQRRMQHADRTRRQQSRDADRDLDRRIDKARHPDPEHSAPPPARSGG